MPDDGHSPMQVGRIEFGPAHLGNLTREELEVLAKRCHLEAIAKSCRIIEETTLEKTRKLHAMDAVHSQAITPYARFEPPAGFGGDQSPFRSGLISDLEMSKREALARPNMLRLSAEALERAQGPMFEHSRIIAQLIGAAETIEALEAELRRPITTDEELARAKERTEQDRKLREFFFPGGGKR